MSDLPRQKRTYPLKMAAGFETCYDKYVHWLKHLLQRLGWEATQAIWNRAFSAGITDHLLEEILDADWEPLTANTLDVAAQITQRLDSSFSPSIEGVTPAAARSVIESAWPIRPLRQRYEDLNRVREVTTYQSLHLFHRGFAMLAEALLDLHSKQGELIAYDIKLSWLLSGDGPEIEAEDFLELFKTPLNPRSFQGAGLDYQLVSASKSEVVIHIQVCELALYYLDHHPRVGYLMACSMDEAEYRAVSDRIHMQRTTTLMEGGPLCDFRIYAMGEAAIDDAIGAYSAL